MSTVKPFCFLSVIGEKYLKYWESNSYFLIKYISLRLMHYELELGDLAESKFYSIPQNFDSIHYCCVTRGRGIVKCTRKVISSYFSGINCKCTVMLKNISLSIFLNFLSWSEEFYAVQCEATGWRDHGRIESLWFLIRHTELICPSNRFKLFLQGGSKWNTPPENMQYLRNQVVWF